MVTAFWTETENETTIFMLLNWFYLQVLRKQIHCVASMKEASSYDKYWPVAILGTEHKANHPASETIQKISLANWISCEDYGKLEDMRNDETL